MIEQVLTILKRGGTATIDQLARELDTTPELIAQLIEYLERSGVLKQLASNCHMACHGCYLARDCDQLKTSRIWLITG
jgi:Mn-dependent DtxR family transcriptional regulator